MRKTYASIPRTRPRRMIGEREIEGHRALTIGSADGELEAAFVPEAGMVCCSLLHRGEEILGQRNGLRAYVERKSTMGIPLLYPWANRLSADRFELAGREIDLCGDPPQLKRDGQGLPIHGLLTAAAGWQLTRHRTTASGAELAARFDWASRPELLSLFPFPHTLTVEARIDSGSLTVTTTVEAAGEAAVPVAFGFHPYFCLPGVPRERWQIELPLSEQLLLDERGLPTGERRAVDLGTGPLGGRSFDDLFLAPVAGSCLAISGGGRRIELALEATYPYAQIYAPAGRQLIALEPMCAPTDALIAGGAQLAAAGSPFAASFSIRVGS